MNNMGGILRAVVLIRFWKRKCFRVWAEERGLNLRNFGGGFSGPLGQ